MTAQQHSVASHSDPLERLVALGEAYVRFAVSHPNEFQLIFDPVISAPAQASPERHELAEEHRALLDRCLADAVADGRSRLRGDPEPMAAALWSTVHGLAHLILLGYVPREAIPATLRALVT